MRAPWATGSHHRWTVVRGWHRTPRAMRRQWTGASERWHRTWPLWREVHGPPHTGPGGTHVRQGARTLQRGSVVIRQRFSTAHPPRAAGRKHVSVTKLRRRWSKRWQIILLRPAHGYAAMHRPQLPLLLAMTSHRTRGVIPPRPPRAKVVIVSVGVAVERVVWLHSRGRFRPPIPPLLSTSIVEVLREVLVVLQIGELVDSAVVVWEF